MFDGSDYIPPQPCDWRRPLPHAGLDKDLKYIGDTPYVPGEIAEEDAAEKKMFDDMGIE